jgi:hypothetical protein
MVVILFISGVYGFYYLSSSPIIWIKKNVELFKVFRFDRFIFFETVAWFFLAAYLTRFAFKLNKKWLYIVTLLFVASIPYFSLTENRELKVNLKAIIHTGKTGAPSYKSFYATQLFDEIKKDINKPLDSFRTISIGLYPAIAQYNGFFTLDSYQNNYPLEYKNKFRKIIENELEKSDWNRWLFDSWGSQCYVFVAELGHNFYITEDIEVKNLGIEYKCTLRSRY